MRVSRIGFALRLAFTIVLVLITFNPSGFSYYHWVRDGFESNLPLKALAGIAILIGYVICIRAAYRSIGMVGAVLVAALLLAFGWVAYDFGVLDVDNVNLMQWLSLIGAGIVLGVGLSWSIIRRMISGQLDVDDVDNNEP